MNIITCPKCGQRIEVTEALKHQVEGDVRVNIEKQVRKEFEEKSSVELKDLKTQLQELNKKNDEYKDQELRLRDEKRKLEQEKKDNDIKIQRILDEERIKIESNAEKKIREKYLFEERSKDKVIETLKKDLEEATRRANVGSQQLQGEVVELHLEEELSRSFPNDQIEPIAKGDKGADIRQIVKSPRGIVCGVILWEVKKVKAWSESWIMKLKSDLRAEKANIPVIITNAFPKEISNGMGHKDGVIIVSLNLYLPLANLLRKNLLEVGFEKVKATHRGEKADYLYEYITSHEFLQQLEAMVEVYRDMKVQIRKERDAYERLWKMRDAQADRLVSSIASAVGSIQGKIGQSVLPVKGLDLLDSGTDDKGAS